VDRLALAFLCDAYREETVRDEQRTVLGFHRALAPIKVAVLPLSKKLEETARKVHDDLRARFHTEYDEAGSIGRRYRRQDEIGTPFCVTVDFDSLEDHAATVRERDTMEQERIPLERLGAYLGERLAG
jgi:glycyl-tRNA synthetase